VTSQAHDAACGYQGFGSGDDPTGPGCVLPKGHDGACSASAAPVLGVFEEGTPERELLDAARALNERIVEAIGGFPMIYPNSWPQVERFRDALKAVET
jgi:hypothetical protein